MIVRAVKKVLVDTLDELKALAAETQIDLADGFLARVEYLTMRTVAQVDKIGAKQEELRHLYFACLNAAAEASTHLTRTHATWVAYRWGFERY